jgi:hypothetical protein
MMSALLTPVAAISAAEAVKMLSSGALLAVAVFKAAKTGKKKS